MAFATIGELEAYSQQEVDPETGGLLLDLSTSTIQAYTGQTIEFVADDAITIAGSWSHELELPERPVTAVSYVAIVDTPPTPRVLVANEDYTFQRSGKLWRPRGYSLATERTFDIGIYANWGGPDREVNIVYSHGLVDIPLWIKAICLEMCKRVVVNPAGIMREAIDGYSVAYDRNIPPGVSLEPAEQKRLDRIRRTTSTARVSA